ncbi:MAG: transposase-like protein, partial [Cellvibrionaceae bacterium]
NYPADIRKVICTTNAIESIRFDEQCYPKSD